MLKKLWCWVWGMGCVWHTTHEHKFTRQARGIYVNVPVPEVQVTVIHQTCGTCGATRIKELVHLN